MRSQFSQTLLFKKNVMSIEWQLYSVYNKRSNKRYENKRTYSQLDTIINDTYEYIHSNVISGIGKFLYIITWIYSY